VARSSAVGVGRAEGETEDSRRLSRSNGESGRHSEFSLFCVRLVATQVSLSVHTRLAVHSPTTSNLPCTPPQPLGAEVDVGVCSVPTTNNGLASRRAAGWKVGTYGPSKAGLSRPTTARGQEVKHKVMSLAAHPSIGQFFTPEAHSWVIQSSA
jgi:hypothetical protein